MKFIFHVLGIIKLKRKFLFKSTAILSLLFTTAPITTQMLSTQMTAFATISKDKVGSLSNVESTAVINKVNENANKSIETDYNVSIKIPKDVKDGDTVRITTVNLSDFIPAGETKAPITIDGVEVGTLTRVENNNKRFEQNSPSTSLDKKKSANIEAGTQDNSYTISFNSKASEYSSKSVDLKAQSSLVYATTVNKDTNVRAEILVNGKVLATKDYTLTATKPTQETKNQKSAFDYSRNTRIQIVDSGTKQTAQNYLGMVILPLDKDYGKGSTIEVSLPDNSMMKFVPATDYNESLSLTHFPLLRDNTEVNGNNVYLYDQQAVKIKAKEIKDNKVIYEVLDGTLKRGDSYVGLPNQTGVNFALTDKAAEKLSEDGKKIGTETVKSVFKSADGAESETQGNSLSISINGGKIDAKGIKDILSKKITTKWVVQSNNKELKKSVTDKDPKPKEDFDGYTYIKSETDNDGNVTHYYKENSKKVTTEWVYTNGEVLKAKVTSDKAQPKEDFDGAIYKETKVDKDGNTTHIYTKMETPKTEVVTNYVEFGTGKVLKDQDKGAKDKAEIKGYKFKETKKDDKGNVTHYYEVESTKEIKKITKFLEQGTNKELSKQEDGVQPKKDISGYVFVESKTDDKTGETIHYYKVAEQVKKQDSIKPEVKQDAKKESVDTGATVSKNILPVILTAVVAIGGSILAFFKFKKDK